MISLEDLKEWLSIDKEQELLKSMQFELDKEIKNEIIKGKTSFDIIIHQRANRVDSVRRPLEKAWYSNNVCMDTLKSVRKATIKKYKDFGFDLSYSSTMTHDGEEVTLSFKDVHKLIED